MARGSTIPPGGCTIVVTITSSHAGHGDQHDQHAADSGAGTRRQRARRSRSPRSGRRLVTKTIAPATSCIGGTATLTITLATRFRPPLIADRGVHRSDAGGHDVTTGEHRDRARRDGDADADHDGVREPALPPGGCTIVVTITSSTLRAGDQRDEHAGSRQRSRRRQRGVPSACHAPRGADTGVHAVGNRDPARTAVALRGAACSALRQAAAPEPVAASPPVAIAP